MAPVVYRQPHQARQLAIAGQAPVENTAGKAAGALQTEGDIAGAGQVLPEPSGNMLADVSRADKQGRDQLVDESSGRKGESAEVQTGTAVSKAAATEKHDGLQQLAMRLVQQQNAKSDQRPAQSSASPTVADEEAAQQIAVESQHNSKILQVDAYTMPVAAGVLDAADLVIPDR